MQTACSKLLGRVAVSLGSWSVTGRYDLENAAGAALRLEKLLASPMQLWPAYCECARQAGQSVVLVAGPFRCPGTSASAEHAFRLGQCVALAGFYPILLPFTDTGRLEDMQKDGSWVHEGVPYLPVGLDSTDGSSPLESLRVYTGHRFPLLGFLKQSDLCRVRAIITMGEGHSGALLRLQMFCRRRNIALVAEEVEWHERSEPDNNRGWVQTMEAEIRKRVLNPRMGHVIGISAFLVDYYLRRGCSTLRLPPILDVENPRWRQASKALHADTGQVRLVFSGSPERDRQDLILAAVWRAFHEGVNVTLDYVGSTREQVAKTPGVRFEMLEKLGERVVFHGRVTEDRLRDILAGADFAVLFREHARWSKACFPSRVPEFLALGIPIICNLTSDLGDYLGDGLEALVVPGLSEELLAAAIIRASNLNTRQKMHMAQCARRRAKESFDIRQHATSLGKFLRAAIQDA